MLQAIRERAEGWFAWAIVVLISVPFALWGIQQYLGGGGPQSVATVEGSKISDRELSQRVQQFRMEMRRRLGAAYRPELLDDARIRKEVLEDMIRSRVVVQKSHDMGLRAGDAQVRATIMAMPAFQSNGHFDKEAYDRALQLQGTDSLGFEQRVRASLMAAQLAQVVVSSELTTDRELRDAVRLRRQQRSFSYFLLPLRELEDTAPIPSKDIEAYYRSHQDAFKTPEQVKVDYLVLAASALQSAEEVSEATLRQMYQAQIDRFRTPERRAVRHILIALPTDAAAAQEQAARERIQAIRARILGGEDFAKVAKEVSQDPGSASQGGSLGMLEPGQMDPNFEKAAFALSKGELSGPVRSAFGFHLIQVTDIEPAKVKPFAQVRGELAAAARSGQDDQKYLKLAERLGNLTYEHPDSLEPAAKAWGLEIHHSGWLSRSGGKDELADPKVVSAAFSDEVMVQGNNSDVIEVQGKGGQRAIVLRVVDRREPAVKPLAEEKDEIAATLRRELASKAAFTKAEAALKGLRQGQTMTQVAGSHPVMMERLMGRDTDHKIPQEVLRQAFRLPQAGSRTPSVVAIRMDDGSAAVMELTQVQDGKLDDMDEDQRKGERRDMARGLARAYYDDLVRDLRRRADVEITAQATRTSLE
jgi:peptidyl-prolyl cis-trans isomerase D